MSRSQTHKKMKARARFWIGVEVTSLQRWYFQQIPETCNQLLARRSLK